MGDTLQLVVTCQTLSHDMSQTHAHTHTDLFPQSIVGNDDLSVVERRDDDVLLVTVDVGRRRHGVVDAPRVDGRHLFGHWIHGRVALDACKQLQLLDSILQPAQIWRVVLHVLEIRS